MLSVRLDKEMERRLDALAQKTNRAKSYYVKKAIGKFLDEQEEIEWASLAYQEFLQSGKKTYSYEQVIKELKLDESKINE